MEPWADLKGTFIAMSTWEGSRDPDVQADPEEAQIPSRSIIKSMDSPSTASNPMDTVFGSLCSRSPLTEQAGIFSRS